MKKTLSNLCKSKWLLFIALCLSGCTDFQEEKPLGDNVILEENTPAAEAKKWYDALKKGKELMLPSPDGLKSSEDKLFYTDPSWKYYAESGKNDVIAVDVDLTDRIALDFVPEENMRAYRQTGELKYKRSYTRLVILSNTHTNEKLGFLMTIIPSVWYSRNFENRILTNTYFHRDYYFVGLIVYHDLDGNFVNGWKYEQGRVSGTITSATAKGKNTITYTTPEATYVVKEGLKSIFGPEDSNGNLGGGTLGPIVIEGNGPSSGWGSGGSIGGGSWNYDPYPSGPGSFPMLPGPGNGYYNGDPNKYDDDDGDDDDDNESNAIVSIMTVSVVEAPDDYNINVDVLNNSQNVTRVVYQMSRAGKNDWKTIKDAPYSGRDTRYTYTRQAWTPGFWQVKAIVYFQNGAHKETFPVNVEEQFPSIGRFSGNTTLRNHLSGTLWPFAVEFAQIYKPFHAVREYGCFIHLRKDGTYYAGTTIEGSTVHLTEPGVAGNVRFDYNDTFYDPRDEVDLIVGTMHTHYPLTWAADGQDRHTGASQEDNNGPLPGIGYDYASTSVSSGHNVNAEKAFFTYGVRRPTTN